MAMTKKSALYTLRAEHLAWQKQTDGRIARVFISKDPKGITRGSFYIIAEISQPSQDGEFLLTSLASTLFKKGLVSRNAPEKRFEELITRANIILKNVGGQTSNTWFGNLHIVFALAINRYLYVSTVGDPGVLLVQGEKITNVIKKSQKRDDAGTPRFEHIVSGKLYPDDTILMITPGLLELFSPEHFEHIIKKYKGLPLLNLEKILKEREETADTPFASLVLRLERRPVASLEREVAQTRKDIFARIVRILKKLAGGGFGRLPRNAPALLHPFTNVRPSFPRIPFTAIPLFSFLHQKLVTIRRPMPIAIVGVLIVSVFLTGLIILAKNKNTTQELSSRIDTIKTSIGDAENALIFNDMKRAQTHIIEARMMLASMGGGTASLPELKQLTETLGKLEDKLLGTVTIENPRGLWEIKENLGVPPSELFFEGENFFAYSENQAIIYRQGEPQKLLFLPVATRLSKAPGVFLSSPPQFLWHEKGSGIHSFNPVTETDTLLGDIPGKPQAADIQYYRTFLYVLTSDGKILKYRRDERGFTDMGEWLKEPIGVPFSSFAVDGAIYIVGDAHTVIKLVNGKISRRWTIPLDLSGAEIVTSEFLSHIYIVARYDNSILQLSKEGEITKRYKSDKFDSLKNILVNERDNKLVVLNDFSVYEINL